MPTIDLRSDTVTKPTPEMRRAMYEAEVGDDVFGEDPTVNRLEAMAAQRMGKEAAVFVASGTMGNLVSGLTHCQRGDEALLGHKAHMLMYESASLAAFGGVQMRTVPNDERGMLDPDQVEAAMRPRDPHQPRTAMVAVENTHNRCSGSVLGSEDIGTLAEIAHRAGAAFHIDGARIFNAAVALGVAPLELARPADTVTFCLSKGLSCPVGSLVCGSEEVIAQVRRNRRMVGGSMRQAGVIAAAGIVALDTMVDRLAEDHGNAKRLALGLGGMPGIVLDPSRIQTNIVIFEVKDRPAEAFIEALKGRGVLASFPERGKVRMVTHYGITAEDIDGALDLVEWVTRERAYGGR
ncbi:MAG: aminotransferase class I/II-fold pyridoxal phosphate-dependent enzyme [Chloroflexi bacterium]|nr:aminotransferase class I/II-fold pyridoxal phosphate-dependent enzyme [Chloroflexota bacterium]